MAEPLTVTIDDRAARVDRSAGTQVAVDGNAIEIVYTTAGGEIGVAENGPRAIVFVTRAGDTTWIFHEGRTYLATVEAEGRASRRTAQASGSLMAPMPATVIAVNVQPGDAVKAGDVLILLEAMKMELPLRAAGDGVVSAVHCAAGDLVQPNVPLVDLAAPNAT
jgi:acetyl/propionyl-CoA carboxylase alpha subunit